MLSINRRAAGFAFLGLLMSALTACGDSEADQRKAFIDFLQTRIVNKSGVHVPKPTAEDTRSFGAYAVHYDVITDFTSNPEMIGIGKNIEAVISKVSVSSVREFVDHRAEFKSVVGEMDKIRELMNRELAKANAARAALKQPDDLKAVYDKAFEKVITAPAAGFAEVLPLVDKIATASLKLGDYIDAHRDKVVMDGKSVGAKDAQTQKDISALIKEVSAYGPQFQAAQNHLRATLYGG
jgi:soluble cytochrome b562